jgi:hypothetical protein
MKPQSEVANSEELPQVGQHLLRTRTYCAAELQQFFFVTQGNHSDTRTFIRELYYRFHKHAATELRRPRPNCDCPTKGAWLRAVGRTDFGSKFRSN